MIPIQKILLAARAPFLSATLLPILLPPLYMKVYGLAPISWLNLFMVVLGVVFIHLGANCLNDYFDWDESDRINQQVSPFNGGSRKSMEGIFQRKSFLIMALVYFLIGMIIWFFLILRQGKNVFFIGLAGLLCGLLYSMKPFHFQKRGLGEFLIFLAFGPLLTMGTGAALGTLNRSMILMGIPYGWLTMNLIFLNEIPDFSADSASGKRNWVVCLGLPRALAIYPWIHGGYYLSLLLLCALAVFPWSLLLLILPLLPLSWLHLKKLKETEPEGLQVPAQKSLIQFQLLSGLLLPGILWISFVL